VPDKLVPGSPIGATIAHMLLGHKAELGIKHISKVNAVTSDPPGDGNDMHLFFLIEDVPADQVHEKKRGNHENKREDGKSGRGELADMMENLHIQHKHEGNVRVHAFAF
jgi:hypothetical protein